MNSKLLSIIIPTFNGGKFLQENLHTLIPMMKSESNNVELIISNNASEDNTDEIVQNALNEYQQIIYIKRPVNIGSMNNFSEAIKVSHGKYILLLGDDDVLIPGFTNIILDMLIKYPTVSLIHWNRIDYKMKTEKSSLFNDNTDIRGFYYEKDFGDFLKNHPTMDSMSTVIFKRECWYIGEEYLKDTYYGYTWYSRILFGSVNQPCIYSFFPLVIQRHPITRKWAQKQPLYTVGLLNIYKDLNALCPGIYTYLLKHSVMTCWTNYINELLIVAKNKKMYKGMYQTLNIHLTTRMRKFNLFLVLKVLPSSISIFYIFILRVLDFFSRRFARL